MPKESGLGWTTYSIDDNAGSAKDIKNDVLNVDWDHPRETLEATGIDKSAHERLVGLADFTVNIATTFNDAANLSYDVFKNAGTTDVARTISAVVSGQTLNNECWLTSVKLNRGSDASMQFAVTAVLENGTDPTWS